MGLKLNRYYSHSFFRSFTCKKTDDENPIREINMGIFAASILPVDRLYNPQIPNTAAVEYLR
jgi:hypothetical protein